MAQKRWVYLIESDPKILDRIKATFRSHFPGLELLEFNRYSDARNSVENKFPTIVIMGLEIEEKFGPFQFTEWLKQKAAAIPLEFIAMGTRATLEKLEFSLESANVAIVPKPLRLPGLYEKIDDLINKIERNENQVVELASGEHLFHEGDESTNVYVLRQGKLKVYHQEQGKNVTLKIVEPPQIVGELAFIDNALRSASVIALEESRLLRLNIGDIEAYLAEQPFWVRLFFKTLSERLKEANKKIVDLSF